jgi:hypothetical protein
MVMDTPINNASRKNDTELLKAGTIVVLDKDMANSSEVKLLYKERHFSSVCNPEGGEPWLVMTSRLSPISEKLFE